ncbi:hypothetical protein Tco_0696732 [Tanacetum coccineum]
MVKEGISYSAKANEEGIEVDKAKIDLILSYLPPPLREFAVFSGMLIGILAFQTLKRRLTKALFSLLELDQPYEIICAASDYARCLVLGQRNEQAFRQFIAILSSLPMVHFNVTATVLALLGGGYTTLVLSQIPNYLKELQIRDRSSLRLGTKNKALVEFTHVIILILFS